jgi:hypothetical protein
MYVAGNFVVLSRNHCCHGNATVLSLFIVSNFQLAVNNTKPVSVAMETEERVLCALLSSYKIFPTVVNKKKTPRALCIFPDTVTASNQIWSFSTDFHKRLHRTSHKSVLWESAVRPDGQRWRI